MSLRLDRLLGVGGGRRCPAPPRGYSPEGGSEAMDAVMRDAQAGSPVALAALAETGRWLGIGIAGLINILNPELILLGGQLAPFYPFVRPTLEAELDRRALRASRQVVRVTPARLGMDAPVARGRRTRFRTPARPIRRPGWGRVLRRTPW